MKEEEEDFYYIDSGQWVCYEDIGALRCHSHADDYLLAYLDHDIEMMMTVVEEDEI